MNLKDRRKLNPIFMLFTVMMAWFELYLLNPVKHLCESTSTVVSVETTFGQEAEAAAEESKQQLSFTFNIFSG